MLLARGPATGWLDSNAAVVAGTSEGNCGRALTGPGDRYRQRSTFPFPTICVPLLGRSGSTPVMGLSGDASRNLLLDPEFWRPRFERLEKEPRQLAIFPRADLCRPGIEVLELRLKAHDGARLTALIARSSFCQEGSEVHLRACTGIQGQGINWESVEAGGTDLIFAYPPERKLEDRVLDVLRVVGAACSLESIECKNVKFIPSDSCVQDEFAIADFLRHQGWNARPTASS